MALDETMSSFHSSLQEDFDDDDDDVDGFDDHHQHHDHDHEHHHPHNLSRLSVCTSSTFGVDDDDDDVDNLVSRLSIEGFEADGELSDGKELPTRLSSDSETELGSYSLPSTPPRRRNRVKDYASDNGGHHGTVKKDAAAVAPPRRRRRSLRSDRWKMMELDRQEKGQGCSGESDHSGVMLITRPKGGNRALCMDLEEVKACRDLGFELEHEKMLEIPTSSGSNSPIANWRISSPGDDPRDVKARLKVWAQAVALVSTSKYGT